MRSITIAKLVTVGSEVIELSCSLLTGIATPASSEHGTAFVGIFWWYSASHSCC
tara:strand:+ start:303 stop:464 length:162 start_codon:yes stop_codon:yes gene_type:complete